MTPTEIALELSIDHLTVLKLAGDGELMIPIGRWERPVIELLKAGLLEHSPHAGDPTGKFNNKITALGEAVLEVLDQGEMPIVKEIQNGCVSDQRLGAPEITDRRRK